MRVKLPLLGIAIGACVTFTGGHVAHADSAEGSIFRVTKAAAPSTANASSTVSFSITIENVSTSNAAPETVVDTLPASFVFAGNAQLTDLQGVQSDFEPTVSGQTLEWTFEGDNVQSIAEGENIVISFSATAPSTPGSYTNEVCLTLPEEVCATATVLVQETEQPVETPKSGIITITGLATLAGLTFAGIGYTAIQLQKKSFEEKVLE
ncbi:MAG: hypothetical protein ACOCXT_05125 [Candidatus Dojkabacteria bacterium]